MAPISNHREQYDDPNEIKIVYLRCIGGELPSTAALSQKLGALGLSAKRVAEDIARATYDEWTGLKITVKLTVQHRQAKIDVVPSAASLIIRELNEPPRDGKRFKLNKRKGNLTLEKIIDIARQMRHRSMASALEGTVKEILGTCQSLNVTVEGQHSHDIIDQIRNGVIKIPDEA
uniref:60S ribosomal protein L12 n=1 Tax=Romanomermis culicivorax TaxID=13658 RepID=A0A915I8A1_ROMCU